MTGKRIRMPSGLIALLDDVATLTKLAAASVDDIGAAAGKAGSKATALLIDDTAVTPRYVVGLSPQRELPIIGKITVGSLRNKLLFLLPVAVLLSTFAPFLIVPLLMIGGSYLAFEATEKILEKVFGGHHNTEQLLAADTPDELEKRQVAGAIRTDFILSAEIMAIALNELTELELLPRIGALALVAVGITFLVYGAVALIVKLDDIGLHMAQGRHSAARAFGRGLVHVVPTLLVSLSAIGTAAMLWVGGGIILHGLEELHLIEFVPHMVHDAAEALGGGIAALEWAFTALGSAVVGIIVGLPIVFALKLWHRRSQTEEPPVGLVEVQPAVPPAKE